MKKILALLAGMTLLTAGCDNEPEGALELVFKARVNGQPMIFEDDYTYPTGESFDLSTLRFMISNISVLKDGAYVKLQDVADVNFYPANGQLSTATSGVTVRIEGVEPGNYEGIRFGLGLTPELDATTPSDHNSGSPLAAGGGYYWEAWGSYIYFKIEGDFANIFYRIHTGGADAFRYKDLNLPIAIAGEQTTTIPLVVDVERIFFDDNDTLNLYQANDTHYSDTLIWRAADHLPAAIRLE